MSALPVLAKDLGAPDVVIPAVAEGFLALYAVLDVARFHERALAGLVLHVRAGADLVQVELPEAVTGAESHRLRRDAPPPHRLLADDDAAFAVPIAPVDSADTGPSDRTPVDLDDPADRVPLLGHTLDEVLLLPDRHRADLQGVANDVEVLEPADVRLRLLLARRPQGAFLAAQDRTEHRLLRRQNANALRRAVSTGSPATLDPVVGGVAPRSIQPAGPTQRAS